MTKVLITGATGNVGREIIRSLRTIDHQLHISAGVREINATNIGLEESDLELVRFDFADLNSIQNALYGCEILFLLRPPRISDAEKYFKPIIDASVINGVMHIVFLSVQGVENSSLIPHHKIEKLIVKSKIDYTFLRPAYFMQNFTTTLRDDLVHKKRIYLPAGNAKFTLIDVRDIGSVAAKIISNISLHINQSYELTSDDKLTFSEMAELFTKILGVEIQYVSPSLIDFFLSKRKDRVPTGLIFVMIMLHCFPRFQKAHETTIWVEKIMNRPSVSFEQFIRDYKIDLSAQVA
jgi:uncharacterized protein YbjT (DUF2867 family)